jgi:hypothetical protein
VTEALLNHVGGSRAGIVVIYQRHNRAEEKRTAMNAWANRLNEIVNDKTITNVVGIAGVRV